MCIFFFSSRRRHTRLVSDWSSDVCSSDLITRLHLADAFLIRAAVAGEPRCMLGKHVARKIDLKSPAARVVFFLSEMIVSWNVHVVCGSVLVERRSALKFL